MANTPYKQTRSQVKKARAVIVLALVTVALGIYLVWPRQAQPATQAVNAATEAPTQTQILSTAQPTETKTVEENLPSSISPEATKTVVEPIKWVPLSRAAVSAPTRYLLNGQCTQTPAGWIMFQSNRSLWEHCMDATPEVSLGEGLVLPSGLAVVPSGKVSDVNYQQDAVEGQALSDPRSIEFWASRSDHYGVARVCLLKDTDTVSDIVSYELVIDEKFDLIPATGGTCFTTVGNEYIQVTFFFLNQIYEEIKNGDFKYEIHLDEIIQRGENQELWLGGKPLSNN